jgi:adenylate kinase family enzyme
MPADALPDLTRTVIVGCSGSGKSTLARQLAEVLRSPYV